MAMKQRVLIVLGSFLVASGCHAGWLKTDQPGIVIQTGGDPSVTTRLAVVEAAVAEMPTRDFNVMGGGLTWSVCAPSRNWTGAALSADGRHQTAVVQWGSIYVSGDYGASWTAKETAHDWGAVAVSADGSRQTACVYDGQMYFSTNYGSTWTTGGASFCWVSVAMSANGERQTAVVDNGYVYVSTNYGSTWTAKLNDVERNWRRVGMSTNGQYQTLAFERNEDGETGEKYGGGLYVSSDYGNTWALKQTEKDWVGVAVSGDGARQTACASGSKMYVSTDYGSTWTPRDENREWRDVAGSADGKMLVAIVAGEPVYVSRDYGATWTACGPVKWWGGVASSADGAYQIASSQVAELWASRASSKVHGDLTVDGGLGVGGAGQLMVRGGTQLVFVVGGVVNVLDADILSP